MIDDELKILKKEREALVDILSSILGPVSREFGLHLAGKVRMYRIKAVLKAVKRVRELSDDANLPTEPNLKILIPWLEGVSLENSEDSGSDAIIELWAQLLVANAVHSDPYDYVIM